MEDLTSGGLDWLTTAPSVGGRVQTAPISAEQSAGNGQVVDAEKKNQKHTHKKKKREKERRKWGEGTEIKENNSNDDDDDDNNNKNSSVFPLSLARLFIVNVAFGSDSISKPKLHFPQNQHEEKWNKMKPSKKKIIDRERERERERDGKGNFLEWQSQK